MLWCFMKNLSEYALCFTNQDWLILHSKDINSGYAIDEENQKIINNCHIYMIHTIPLVCFLENSISYNYEQNILSGQLKVALSNGEVEIADFSFDFPLVDNAVSVKCSYPHKEITTHNQNDEVVRFLPAYAVAQIIQNPNLIEKLSRLKIEYIGQAYGDGTRNAFDRLKSHSTLQKILAEITYYSPDLEVFVSLISFQEPRLITFMDGIDVNSYDEKLEYERFRDIIETPLSKKEQVNLIEAGLIRYFQPNYNLKLKYKFPSTKQQILSTLSNLDISGLIIELDSSELGYQVYTNLVRATNYHFAKYDLTTNENRTSFFRRSIQVTNPDEVVQMSNK